jgi:prefoldin beta subunit
MEIDKETEKQIQELQILENSLQSLLMQKQAFQLELSETENALEELEKTKDDVYKIVGQIMIKASKDNLSKELGEKKDMLSMRLKSFDAQEEKISESSEILRKKVLSKIQK